MTMKYIILLIALLVSDLSNGQPLQEYLQAVAANNPEIVAYRKLLEARVYESRTGNTPSDPFVTAGIFPGTPDAAGTKKTWSITQSFAFPTKYLLQKKVNNGTIRLAEEEFNLGMLQIMLYAKESWFDLSWKIKHLNNLQSRMMEYNKLQGAWKKMLENGHSTIMDYNRIMLGISDVKLSITRTQSDIEMLKERLAYLNGSGSIVTSGDYPITREPDPESLLKEKSAVHPSWLIPELEYEISLREVRLNRTGSLPVFQLGYESEMVPGVTYTGPVGGISIPLWSNSNKVKAASARSEHLSAQRDALFLRLNSQVRSEYSNMKAIRESIENINAILETGGGTKYLDTALDAGEISVTTYFTYLEAIYKSEDRLLELQNEYQKSLARLTDHELLLLNPYKATSP